MIEAACEAEVTPPAVDAESVDSDTDTVWPTIHQASDRSAGFHRAMPPRAFIESIRRGEVVNAERDGPVVAAVKGSGNVPGATFKDPAIGPSEAGAASAVGVAPSVESRANTLLFTF